MQCFSDMIRVSLGMSCAGMWQGKVDFPDFMAYLRFTQFLDICIVALASGPGWPWTWTDQGLTGRRRAAISWQGGSSALYWAAPYNSIVYFIQCSWLLRLITTIDNKDWFLLAVGLAKTSHNVDDCDRPAQWFEITDSPNKTVLRAPDFKSAFFVLFDATTKTKPIPEPSCRVLYKRRCPKTRRVSPVDNRPSTD